MLEKDLETRHREDHRPPAEDRKQRKRIQNRLNQQARRLRVAAEKPKISQSKPFRVDRFRLEHVSHQAGARNRPSLSEAHSTDNDSIKSGYSIASHNAERVELHFSSDHLLHLVRHTLLRALFLNKDCLRANAYFTKVDSAVITSRSGNSLCGEYTVLQPRRGNIPKCLMPTDLQMNQPHSAWIDAFPFERFRDNLIVHEDSFDHEELFEDLFGHLTSIAMPRARRTHGAYLGPSTSTSPEVSEDSSTVDRKALICWGEPYLKQSWEVTPGFVAKWSWAFEGEDEMIESSNKWRLLRGEAPMQC